MIIGETIDVFNVDQLEVRIYPNRETMGKAAAKDVAVCMLKKLAEQEMINMVFAAAPSQKDFLTILTRITNLCWEKVIGFHMDEYLGLPLNSEASFGHFLKTHLFDKVPFLQVNYLNSRAVEPEKECARYTALIKKTTIDIVAMGIGENGHIAFNDPQVADFQDQKWVKIIQLDDACRQQQVNDGCFGRFDNVPSLAMTMTIPALMSGELLFCVVPGKSKANAVRQTLIGKIEPACPASILRQHSKAVLYLDRDSAKAL